MKQSPSQLKATLEHMAGLLETQPFFFLSPAEKETAAAKTDSLLTELTAIKGQPLTIGLLGGTGVGKSSLMNALAGVKIASMSDRRPHTDRVLIYRHETAPTLPQKVLAHIPFREVIHQSTPIKDILLCDLPDFDSLAPDHKDQVLRVLKQLDLLIWVTSPEKYADSSLYESIAQTYKAHQNFYFVLNKADIFFERRSIDQGHKELGVVMQGFSDHLRAHGIEQPLMYTLSAKEAMGSAPPSPWNQFPLFSHQIFQQRDAKQIAAIKRANLTIEVDGVFKVLQKETRKLQHTETVLDDITADLDAQHGSWRNTGKEIIAQWLSRYRPRDILPFNTGPSPLIGPGHGLETILNKFGTARSPAQAQSADPSNLTPPEDIAHRLEKSFERIEDRIVARLLSESLPPPIKTRLQHLVDAHKHYEDLGERFFKGVTAHSAQHRPVRMWGFRAIQSLLYTLVWLLFVSALGGETGWEKVAVDPGISSILRLVITMVHTLFSPKGLAALATVLMLNLFLGFRFYRHYTVILDRKANKYIDLLQFALQEIWDTKLTGIQENIEAFKAEIQRRRTALSEMENK